MDQLTQNLCAIVGRAHVRVDADELLVYECDGLTQHKHLPRAVVFPATTEEVAAVVKELWRAGVPFAPRGAGTGLSGGALAVNRGVVVELARMRRVLKVDVENRYAVVEAGVVNARLSRHVAAHGLHYVPDPSSGATCTVGGNLAENAGGIHCLKYGTTTDHILGARVVLADGDIVDLGLMDAGLPPGTAPGYDLLGLFVGSEGTFGIATEMTVRLASLPAAVRTLLADFTDINDASRAVSAIIAGGLVPAALEMVDGATIRAVEASVFAAGLPLDAEAALLIELDGLADGLDDEAEQAASVCRAHGARHVRLAADEAERKKLWAARKGAFGAMGRLAPDLMLQDAVVPRSRLPEVLAETYHIGARYELRVANVFHAGDGNLHPFICYDRRDPEQVRRVEAASKEIMQACVNAGGTITGEHGVGLDKSDYLPLIFSADDLDAMLCVRYAFDPSGLCNPGKIIPAPRGCGEARAVGSTVNGQADAIINEPMSAAQRRLDAGDAQTVAVATTSALKQVRADNVRAQATLVDEAKPVNSLDEAVINAAPATIEEAAAWLHRAAANNWAVVPCGADASSDADAAMCFDANHNPSRARLNLSTARLTRLVRHEPADLVATAEAGMTLTDFNAAVGRAGQWLPLDPPGGDGVTLGGLVANGRSGAQSYGYGPARAHVLGLSVILADGRRIKVGGVVVKNVAGYDLCKLFTGSCGTLGLITEVTFKLRPRPAQEATIIVRATDIAALFAAARALLAGQFLPIACELVSPRFAAELGLSVVAPHCALLVRFAGTEAAVNAQLARAQQLFASYRGGATTEVVADDAYLWHSLAAVPSQTTHELIWRAHLRPTALLAMLEPLAREMDNQSCVWHAGVGDGRVRVLHRHAPSSVEARAWLTTWREQAHANAGALVVERAPIELTQNFEATGLAPATRALMRRLKQQLDPTDSFSPGRCAR